jgi:16S rRNA (guanine527-N7)-methyltransferase
LSDQKQFTEILRARVSAAGIALSSEQEQALEAYFDLLQRWNRRINLTALPLEPPTDAAIDRLFIEGLSAAATLGSRYERWIDLGSGGGSPAIPMKICWPRTRLTMVESRTRKSAFLREAIREIPLAGATVIESRFESLAGANLSADLVTVRAVKQDPALFRIASDLLAPEGCLVTFGAEDGTIDSVETVEFRAPDSRPLIGQSFLRIFRKK